VATIDEFEQEIAPPARPLWDGIYNFPWRLDNLKVLISVWLGLTILSLSACGYHLLLQILASIPPEADMSIGAAMVSRGAYYVFKCLTVISPLVCLYPAAYFLRAVEDTAAGNDEIFWEDIAWYECIKKLLFLLWIAVCCAAVAGGALGIASLVLPIPRVLWWLLVILVTMLLFPLSFLSTMWANTPWAVVHPAFLARLFQKPQALVALYLNTVFFAVPCILLGYWEVIRLNWLLAPLVGFAWATYWLAYGRVLGRVGWVIAEDENKRRQKKKRKRAG
jgi:hypothetical protein